MSTPGEDLGSLVAVGLQCAGDCSPEVRRRSKRTSPCYLCVGGDWAAAGCVSAAGAHGQSLLAQYPLELALNGSSENHQTAINEPLLVVILGPTASGKTALSMAVAEKFQGEIVNCDSVAMYREFDIGTAKPSLAERARVPHHLFDYVDPTHEVTAGEYARQARQVLSEIKVRGQLPIVVGGTGLYLRALLEGLFAGPERSELLRGRLRELSKRRGSVYLHRILRRLDAAAAEKVHANDAPKLIRAIEVCLASRRKMSELWQQGREPLRGFQILRIGLDPERSALYERINERAHRMFESGLIEETQRLSQKYGATARPLKSLGYKQAIQFLGGGFSREAAIEAARQAHRNYAKRQMTWFRREPHVIWFKGFGDQMAIQQEATAVITTSLSRTGLSRSGRGPAN
jgi:tRNA dimethylallyltransferase